MSLEGTYDSANIFAKILRGEAPCIKVFEDDDILAFMDIFPQSQGHCLLIPKNVTSRNLTDFPTEKIGTFDTELVEEFWQAVASNAQMNLHLVLHHGTNSHHISEGLFKATARALRQATTIDPRQTGVPSSKGTL